VTLLCGAKMAESDVSAISAPQIKRQGIGPLHQASWDNAQIDTARKRVSYILINSKNYTSAFRRLRCAITHPKNPCSISNYLLDPRSSRKTIQTPIILIFRFGAEIDSRSSRDILPAATVLPLRRKTGAPYSFDWLPNSSIFITCSCGALMATKVWDLRQIQKVERREIQWTRFHLIQYVKGLHPPIPLPPLSITRTLSNQKNQVLLQSCSTKLKDYPEQARLPLPSAKILKLNRGSLHPAQFPCGIYVVQLLRGFWIYTNLCGTDTSSLNVLVMKTRISSGPYS